MSANVNKISSANGHYAHKFFIETEFSHGSDAKNTWLKCQGYEYESDPNTIPNATISSIVICLVTVGGGGGGGFEPPLQEVCVSKKGNLCNFRWSRSRILYFNYFPDFYVHVTLGFVRKVHFAAQVEVKFSKFFSKIFQFFKVLKRSEMDFAL